MINDLVGKPEVLHPVDEQWDLKHLNESQKRAVWKALKTPFTVIQGPPGTLW